MPAIKAVELRRARLRRRLTIRQLADRCGSTYSHVYNVEREIRRPSLVLLDRLADALEVPVETLVIDLEDLGLAPTGEPRGGDEVSEISPFRKTGERPAERRAS